MTGKELVLVLAGAAAAAGAGGMAAATLLKDAPADSGDASAVLERLDRLTASLDDTNALLEQSRDEIGGLRGRIDAVELGLRGVPAAPRASDSGRRRVDVARHGALDGEEVTGGATLGAQIEATEDEVHAELQEALGALKQRLVTAGGPQIGTVIGPGGEVAGLSGALSGLQRSFELRRLPEEERWSKAREEVGLNDVQVEEIKAALAERDTAIDASMVVERDETDGAQRISVRRMDFEKTREANEAYRRRVDNVLNDEQKKAWKEKGYENAFGRGAMGTATVISIGSISTGGGDEKPR